MPRASLPMCSKAICVFQQFEGAMFGLSAISEGPEFQPASPVTSRRQSWSKTVRNSANSHPQRCGKPSADLFDMSGLIGWLKVRFPTSTEFHVQASTGISAASVANWLQRRSRPSAEHLSILLCAFGPSLFRAAIREPATWIERACEAERLHEIDQQMDRLRTEKAALVR